MKKRIICIEVNHGSEAAYFKRIKEDIKAGEKGYVCFSNVHMLIEAYDNSAFGKIVNSSRYTFPDGFPIARSFKLLWGIRQERIAGMDFLPNFLEVCDQHAFKVAFVGSTPEILGTVKEKIQFEFPAVEITAMISPPFGKKWNNEAYASQINAAATQVVFVALGCPKQEKWMYENTKSIEALLFGIGGALPTYAGTIQRAPNWMQNSGLEWIFRLYKEPRRMFRRYLYTNSKFLYLLFWEWIRVITKKNEQRPE